MTTDIEAKRQELKTMVRGLYDLQHLRIATGNRLAGNFRVKLGQKPGTKESEIEDKENKKMLKRIKASYDRITDGVVKLPSKSKFTGDKVISTYSELILVRKYIDLLKNEEEGFKYLEPMLVEFPIYTEFLKGVRGVGPAMAGVIIAEIDISKAKYASSLWKYCGLDVAPDGAGRSKRKEHLVDKEYTDKDGKKSIKKGITYNDRLKTKLVGVLGGSFIKQPADKCKYRKLYDDYKHRMENHKVYGIANDEARKKGFKKQGKGYAPKLHRHKKANRYAVKIFLQDLYEAWRPMEGLKTYEPYHEAKLGIKHAA